MKSLLLYHFVNLCFIYANFAMVRFSFADLEESENIKFDLTKATGAALAGPFFLFASGFYDYTDQKDLAFLYTLCVFNFLVYVIKLLELKKKRGINSQNSKQ